MPYSMVRDLLVLHSITKEMEKKEMEKAKVKR